MIVVHLLVPLEFYKIRRRGNQILVAQRCFNNFGHFLSLLEFGQQRGFIAVPEGSEGWVEEV